MGPQIQALGEQKLLYCISGPYTQAVKNSTMAASIPGKDLDQLCYRCFVLKSSCVTGVWLAQSHSPAELILAIQSSQLSDRPLGYAGHGGTDGNDACHIQRT